MKKYDLLLSKARVIDPKNNVDKVLDVAVTDGKVVKIAERLDHNLAKQTLNMSNTILIPGVIDSHVHVARKQAKAAGYRMVVKAGVTTVVDMEGPLDLIKGEIDLTCGLNIAVMEGIIPGDTVGSNDLSSEEINRFIEKYINQGALGVKILGGHYPFTPETTSSIIEEAFNNRVYAAFHVGTTATSSTVEGLEEAVKLARGKPLHIAHVNAYCRGLIDDPLIELKRSMDVLANNKNLVSESHLAPFNGCSGRCWRGMPESHVTRNCLKMKDYEVSEEGVRNAILDGYAAVYASKGSEMELLWGKEAQEVWEDCNTSVGLSFPVNLRTSAFVCAIQKDNNGKFIVEAISSDGGAIPRNFILKMGMGLVRFGGLTLPEFVSKISYAPAQMLGLENKGHLTPGADADITIINPLTGRALMTIIGGKVAMSHGLVIDTPGKILTTAKGVKTLQKQKIPYEVVELEKGFYFSRYKDA